MRPTSRVDTPHSTCAILAETIQSIMLPPEWFSECGSLAVTATLAWIRLSCLEDAECFGGMLTSAVAAARASEPGSASRYEYTWTAGGRYEFTAAARDQWKSDHHRAIKTWREVADLVGHVADLLKEAERALESRPHSEYWSVQRPHEERARQIDLLAEQLRLIRPQLEHNHRHATNRMDALREELNRIGP
jgi:hypothetical protein